MINGLYFAKFQGHGVLGRKAQGLNKPIKSIRSELQKEIVYKGPSPRFATHMKKDKLHGGSTKSRECPGGLRTNAEWIFSEEKVGDLKLRLLGE